MAAQPPVLGRLLLLIAGAELLLLPLPLNSLGLIIHVGIGGIAGILIGAVLILCALLLWFNPAQRTFYSVVAVLLSIAALIASNLGGFFLGTLLGVIGGSMGFAWAPGLPPRARPGRGRRRAPDGPSAGLGLIRADAEPATPPAPPTDAPEAGQHTSAPAGGHWESWPAEPPGPDRTFQAFVVVPVTALLLLTVLPGGPASRSNNTPSQNAMLAPVASPTPTPTGSPVGGPTGSPSPSPTGTPAPAPSPAPDPTGTPAPGPTASPTSSPTPSPAGPPSPGGTGTQPPGAAPGKAKKAAKATAPALDAAAQTSTLTAGSASLSGLSFDGVAQVPTAQGTVPMLKFSMDSMDLAGGTVLTVTEVDGQLAAQATSIDFTGHVTLLTTKISGDVLGVPVTYSPQNPPVLLPPETVLTNVVADQPYTTADSVLENGLTLAGR